MNFSVNRISWTVIFVSPLSNALIDRTGKRTLATTSPVERCVYISNNIYGNKLTKVIRHELGHVIMVSYGLLPDIFKLVRDGDVIGVEEYICNFNAEYGDEITSITREILLS